VAEESEKVCGLVGDFPISSWCHAWRGGHSVTIIFVQITCSRSSGNWL